MKELEDLENERKYHSPKNYMRRKKSELPEHSRICIPFPHPSKIEFEVDVENGTDKYLYRDGIGFSEDELEDYYYSLYWLRYMGTGLSKRVAGEFMHGIFELEVNNNPVPLLQLFWTLVGKDVADDLEG